MAVEIENWFRTDSKSVDKMDKFVLKIALLAQLLCVSYAQFDFFGSSLGILNGYEYPSSTGFGLNVKEKWIEQPLNHFDRQDVRTWKMRYLQNEQYYVEGGPIFIFVGGESTVSKIWLENSHMHDMARDLNGTMFHTEHRYYGQSRPTENISVESMRFLNVDQALADLAHFISFVKRTYPGLSDARVVIVGVSYAASMVTWFMQKYPHLIDGAWSSSAPVFAHVNFIGNNNLCLFDKMLPRNIVGFKDNLLKFFITPALLKIF